jgi:hypothetical protein
MRKNLIAGGFGESREGVRGEDTRAHEERGCCNSNLAARCQVAFAGNREGVTLRERNGRYISLQSKREFHECKAHGSPAMRRAVRLSRDGTIEA